MRQVIITVILLQCFQPLVFAKGKDSSKIKLGILPSLSSGPETRLSFGGLFYTYFRTDKKSRLSNTQSYFGYTLNKQYYFENDLSVWLKQDQIHIHASADIMHFPELFFGLGNSTKKEDAMLSTFDMVRFHARGVHHLGKQGYLGMTVHYENLYNFDMPLKNNLNCTLVDGGNGYATMGVGPVFMIDKRNNPLNPTHGFYLESSFQYYRNTYNLSEGFNSFIFDIRKFDTLLFDIVGNSSIYLHSNQGKVPYRMLSTLGGARHLRGYYKGRFRDNHMVVVQQEFRRQIYGRFGLALFGGVGAVANKWNAFKLSDFHYSYGAGLRFKLVRTEDTNLRIDYGITKDSRGIYIVFAEAF